MTVSAATPPPLPPPLAPAQATPSPSYHSFGARQPPHCTCPYVPHGYTRATAAAAHRTWYPPSKKCKSFVPFTSNFPLTHTPHRLTNLAPQGHLDKFFFFFFFLLISHRCRTTALTTSLPSPPIARTKAPPACPPLHHSRQASESATTRPHLPPTRRPCRAQPGRRRYPDYIASTLTQPPVAATTSATSIPSPRHPLRVHQPHCCTHPHMRRRHTSGLPPSN